MLARLPRSIYALFAATFALVAAVGTVLLSHATSYSPTRTASSATYADVSPGLTYISDSPAAIDPLVTVWTGSEVLTFGLSDDQRRNIGFTYEPVSKIWKELPAAPFETRAVGISAVWTGMSLVVLGVLCDYSDAPSESSEETSCAPGTLSGAVFTPKDGTWSKLQIPDYLSGNSGENGINTAGVPIGTSEQLAFFNIGRDLYSIDPTTGIWSVFSVPAGGQLCVAEGGISSTMPIDSANAPVEVGAAGTGVRSLFLDKASGAWGDPAELHFEVPAGVEFACGNGHLVAYSPYLATNYGVLDLGARAWSAVKAPSKEESAQPLPSDLQKRAGDLPTLSYLNNVAWTGRGVLLSSLGFHAPAGAAGPGSGEVDFAPYALASDDFGVSWRSVEPGPTSGGAVTWLDGFAFAIRTDEGKTTLWSYKP